MAVEPQSNILFYFFMCVCFYLSFLLHNKVFLLQSVGVCNIINNVNSSPANKKVTIVSNYLLCVMLHSDEVRK
jgi:hypothetical protein